MSDNENIEAKLCSYVEGDLDAEGRAEIEKYLLAHPQYRPLIGELSRTRELVRGLPRDAAPAELLETLSGQIERSALLGNDDPATMRIRTSRLPHLAAWAAVLVLMAGLAAVIYRVLPTNRPQSEVALLKAAPQPTTAPQSVTVDAQKPELSLDGESTPVAAAPMVAVVQSPSHVDRMSPSPAASQSMDLAVVASPTTLPAEAFANAVSVPATGPSMESFAMRQQFTGSIVSAEATQAGQNMAITLHASDVKAVNSQLADYLNRNGIPFESHAAGESVSPSLATSEPAQALSGPALPAQALPAQALPAQALPAQALNDASPTGTNAAQSSAVSAVVEQPMAVAGRILSTQIASSQAIAQVDQIPARRTTERKQSMTNLSQPLLQTQLGQDDTGNVIIAQNLTAQQASQLSTMLGVQVPPSASALVATASTPAVVVNPGGVNSGAGNSGLSTKNAPLEIGQTVRIVAREKLLPDVDAMNESQTIDADGNLTFPMIGKIKAAGLTDAQLAEKIPQAYRDAKSPTDANWVIDRVMSNTPATNATLTLAPPLQSVTANDTAATSAPTVAVENNGAGAEPIANAGFNVTIRVVGPMAAAAPEPATQPLSKTTDVAKSNPPAMPPVARPAATMPASAPAP